MTRIKHILQIVLLLLASGLYAQTPFFEDFEQAPDTPVNGEWQTAPSRTWRVFETGTGNTYTWNSVVNVVYPPHSGSKGAYIRSETLPPGQKAIDWLVTPAINLAQYQSPKLQFFSRLGLNGDQGSIMKIYISSTPNAQPTDFQLLKQWTETQLHTFQQVYSLINVDIPVQYANSTVYLAFVMEGNNIDRWLIDDVNVAGTCVDPSQFTQSDRTTNSSKVSWPAIGPTNEWEVVVSDIEGGTPDFTTHTPFVVTQPFINVTNTTQGVPLQSGKGYRVYVRSKCHADNIWSFFTSIKTKFLGSNCQTPVVIPPALPYISTGTEYATTFNQDSMLLNPNPDSSCGNNALAYLKNYTIHTYTPTANTTINISAKANRTGTAIFVYNSCANIGVSCLASDINDIALEKKISNLAVTSGTTYYIVVGIKDDFFAGTTAFSLSITEPCSSADIEATFDITNGPGIIDYIGTATITSLGGANSLLASLYNEEGLLVATQTVTSTGTISFNLFSYPTAFSFGRFQIVLQNQQNPNCILVSPKMDEFLIYQPNDECENATVLPIINNTDVFSLYAGGNDNLNRATVSNPINCAGPYRDMWYKFVATSTEHYISISFVSTNEITHSLYSGNFNALTQLYCNKGLFSKATGLTVGQTYTIRVSRTSASQDPIDFTIIVSNTLTNCMANNPQSDNVKELFINLLNAISKKPDHSAPYTCPELIALTPFITVPNPMIYGGSGFSFANNSANVNGFDVLVEGLNASSPVKDIIIYDYTNPNTETLLEVIYPNFISTTTKNWVQNINFCPAPCDPIAAKIVINPSGACVVAGANNVFALETTATGNIANYSWVVYNEQMNPVSSYYTANPTIVVNGSGTFMVRLIVTTTSGCTTKLEKYFKVTGICPSTGDDNGNGIPDNTEPGNGDPGNPGSGSINNCALYNPQSETVKELYINLLNHLFTRATSGTPIPPVYTCAQLTALAPYITGGQAVLYNTVYENGILKFSFINDGSGNYDVIVKNNGVVNDIYLADFNVNGKNYNTTYINGNAYDMHFIKNVNFCPGEGGCGDFTGSIVFSPGVNTITPYTDVQFSLNATESDITAYNWVFFDIFDNQIFQSNDASPIVNLPANSEPYRVKLEITRANECKSSFVKLAFVPDIKPSEYCSESNNQSEQVKQRLINLINHLYTIYTNGGSISSPYFSDETLALASYNIFNSEYIYDVSYDGLMLRFSFYPGQPYSNVQVEMHGPIENIIVLVPNGNPYDGVTTFALSGSTMVYPKINSVIFCPQEGEGCTPLIGEIKFKNGVSCVQVNHATGFSFSENYSYPLTWTFYNQSGNSVIGTSTEPYTYMTYASPGNYLIKLEIDLGDGCKQEVYKTITVSTTCGGDTSNGDGTGPFCTETNETSALVRDLLKTFLNSVIGLNGALYDGFSNIELSALAPYTTDPNPAMYNISYTNSILSFSLSPNTSQPDVVIANYGTIADLNILNYSGSGNPDYIATYQDGRQFKNFKAFNINFCPPQPCYSHVAFVLDESASISEQEAQRIRIQLRAFVEQQVDSNMTVSFTGMADSDTYNRTDHVYGQIRTDNKQTFLTWIDNYKSGLARPGVSANSDYWASGLQKAMQGYDMTPEIIIVLTDGSQTANVALLKAQISNIINSGISNLYVFGVGNGYYVNDSVLPLDPNAYTNTSISDVTPRLMSSIKYLMGMNPAEFPESGKENLLSADYYETTDFSEFGDPLSDPNNRFFSDRLASANIGCGGEPVPLDFCYDCETFQPAPGQVYWLSAWATEEQNIQVKTFTNAVIKITFLNQAKIGVGEVSFLPEGEIIDGWQRFASKFEIPAMATMMNIELKNLSPNIPVYFDDIRIHPLQGSMKSFVYDPETFRLMAEQDDNNYSTFYEYDNEGGLVRIKKETSKGIKTIQETRSGSVIQPTGN